MNKDILNHLIKKSDLTKTDYYLYNQPEIPTKKEPTLTFDKLSYPTLKDYIVLDFETTGFSATINKILEIGAIRVENNLIVDKFCTLINPNEHIPPFISTKIHITNSMVVDKPYINDIFPKFMNFLGKYPLVIHNARFDMSFLIQNGINLGFDVTNSALDTVATTRNLFPELKKYNLAFLCSHFSIKNPNAHRAMSDALATYELYKILFNKHITTK